MKNNKYIDQRSSNVLALITVMYTIIIALMVTGLKGIINYASFGLLVLIYFIYHIGTQKSQIPLSKAEACFTLFMAFYIITSIPHINIKYSVTYTSYYILSFSPIIMSNTIIHSKDKAIIKKALKWALLIWGTLSIISIGFYITHPSAARLIAVEREEYGHSIFGGYQFAFGSSLLLVYLLQFITDKRFGKKWNVLAFITCTVLFVEILLTESTLTTFSAIIGIIAWVFFDNKNRELYKSHHLFIGVILLSLVVGLLYYIVQNNLSSIVSWLSARNDVVLSRRLIEIINKFFFSETSGHYQKRTDALEKSFNLFLRRPLVGWGIKYGYVFSDGFNYGIGNHSELFDSMAKYGIIGFVPLFFVYYYSMKEYCKKRISLLFAFFVLILFNPFSYFQSHLPIFYIIPLSEYLISNKNCVSNQ